MERWEIHAYPDPDHPGKLQLWAPGKTPAGAFQPVFIRHPPEPPVRVPRNELLGTLTDR